MRLRREPRPDVAVAPGERVLAWTDTDTGQVLAGTRDALYLEGLRLAWEQIEAAEWDRDTGAFTVAEVGEWGEQRPMHSFAITEPRLLLELVRERVTASVVLTRHTAIQGRRGVRVIARRAPRGGELTWIFEYDAGIDPDDPVVRAAADIALTNARAEVGLG